jgi:hypothetical protein
VDRVVEDFFGPCLPFSFSVSFLFSLIDEHVSVLDLFLGIVATILSSECLFSEVVDAEISDKSVVEFVPFVSVPVLNVGIIVAAVCIAHVHDNSLENVVVIVILFHLLLFCCLGALLFSQVLPGVFLEVELLRELAVVVHFQFHHFSVVELEPLQSDNQIIGQFFEAHSFDGGHLLAAPFAEVGIVGVEGVSLDHRVEGLVDVFLVFYCQTDR